MFIRKRTVGSRDWTDEDTTLALALEDYEAQCCDRGHYLPESTKQEHADAYRPGERVRCHECKAEHSLAEVMEKEPDTAGVLVPMALDPDVVALNQLPVPPLPAEFAYASN